MKIETSMLIVAFITAIILGFIIIPILRKLKVGQIERDDGPKSHLKKQGTPTMGGIIIIITMILVVTGAYLFLSWQGQNETANRLIPMLILTIGFGIIGFIDDFKKLVLKNTKGLKPSYKMLGLLVISVIYVIYLVLLVLGIVMGIKAIVSAKEYAHHKLFLANGLLAIVVPVILSIHYSYAYDYQAQGRYVMPVLPIIMFLAAIGFGKAEACFSKKYFKVSGITALLWVFLFISILLTTIVPHCMAVPAGI